MVHLVVLEAPEFLMSVALTRGSGREGFSQSGKIRTVQIQTIK